MDPITVIGYIAGAFGLIATLAAAIVVIRSTTTKETISQQAELITVLTTAKAEQKDQIEILQGQHAEAMKAISNLQGQIEVLKTIPLSSIDSTLKELSAFTQSVSKSNGLILERLDSDAKIKELETSNSTKGK